MRPESESIPTEADFLDPRISNGLDLRCAIEHFLGKTSTQAQAMFRQSFLTYQEDLANMGPRAFGFYVRPAIRYLLSDDADGDSDAPSTFCSLIEGWMRRDVAAVSPIAETLVHAIDQMLRTFDRFACEAQVYGDVPARLRTLVRTLAARLGV